MNFATLFASVSLGTTVTFSDGTPRPHEHHKKKLRAWEDHNGIGRIVRKKASGGRSDYDTDELTLHLGDHGSGAVIVLRVYKTFSERSGATFEVLDTLPAGFAIISDSVHVGRELHAYRATRDAIEAEKTRGFNTPSYRIVEIDETGNIVDPLEEVA